MKTTSKINSIDFINEIFINLSLASKPVEFFNSWGLYDDGDLHTDLHQWAMDYLSDEHTNNCEAVNASMYEN